MNTVDLIDQGVLGILFFSVILALWQFARWLGPRIDRLSDRLFDWMDFDQAWKSQSRGQCQQNLAVLSDTNAEVRRQTMVLQELLNAARVAATEIEAPAILEHIERAQILLTKSEGE